MESAGGSARLLPASHALRHRDAQPAHGLQRGMGRGGVRRAASAPAAPAPAAPAATARRALLFEQLHPPVLLLAVLVVASRARLAVAARLVAGNGKQLVPGGSPSG